MEAVLKQFAVSNSVAVQIAKLVNIADLLFKEAKKAGDTATQHNPTLQAYQALCSNPAYQSLVDPNFLSNYTIVCNIQMNDIIIQGAKDLVYYGFIAQNKSTQDYVIAIRGTENLLEALADAFFVPTTFNEFNNNSLVPTGFYDLYKSGQIVSPPDANPQFLVQPLSNIAADPSSIMYDSPKVQTIVTGHSLGASLATYYAAAAATGKGKGINLCCCTYASPMSGDTTFASTFNSLVPDSIRIHNVPDIVPGLPQYFINGKNIYRQVDQSYQIDSSKYPLVNPGPACAHQLPVYEYVLENMNGIDNPDILNFGDGNCKVNS